MRIGLYCGSFDPFHKGHLNIYQKAKQIFDRVFICKGVNPEKQLRSQMLTISGISISDIVHYDYLTTTLIDNLSTPSDSVTLIRGLRNGYDYDYEMNQIQVMRDILKSLQVVMIPCDRAYSHISSSMIRALQKFDVVEAQKYLPE